MLTQRLKALQLKQLSLKKDIFPLSIDYIKELVEDNMIDYLNNKTELYYFKSSKLKRKSINIISVDEDNHVYLYYGRMSTAGIILHLDTYEKEWILGLI